MSLHPGPLQNRPSRLLVSGPPAPALARVPHVTHVAVLLLALVVAAAAGQWLACAVVALGAVVRLQALSVARRLDRLGRARAGRRPVGLDRLASQDDTARL